MKATTMRRAKPVTTLSPVPTDKIEAARVILKGLIGFAIDTKPTEKFGNFWYLRGDILADAMRLGDMAEVSEEQRAELRHHLEQAVRIVARVYGSK